MGLPPNHLAIEGRQFLERVTLVSEATRLDAISNLFGKCKEDKASPWHLPTPAEVYRKSVFYLNLPIE